MILTAKDFRVASGHGHPYFSASAMTKRGPIEICLEPCLEGYCVGIYLMNERPYPELIMPKRCTKTPVRMYEMEAFMRNQGIIGGRTQLEAMEEALRIANEMYYEAPFS